MWSWKPSPEQATRVLQHPLCQRLPRWQEKRGWWSGDRCAGRPRGDEGVIEATSWQPRRNLLFRQDEWRTKSFAANLDLLLVLVAGEPVFSESQLTRALIAAQAAGIPR
jgi:putative ribosome biogenesis GTPase RsgA